MSDLNSIGGRIKYYRLVHGFSQEKISTKATIDVCTLKRYENNQVIHSLDICNKIATVLNIDPFLIYDDYLSFIACDYGNKIKIARNKMKLTQKDLGDLLSVHRKTVTRWEKEITFPLREHFKKFKKYL
ncbi:helix-turn-helix transcriptional regulator [Marinisporobacter balticus]|uniref:helix-turn-helix transcriptional regulator n=1 Tax=Marinisporobacter balticus TaxID=2018667 RepID=UPI00104D6999|nr:helix-turn-helix transcriptional regulator [Marinisporobacter balticus]